MARRSWRNLPSVDGLESRQLLSTQGAVGSNPLNVRTFAYHTATGALVGVSVAGSGNLVGTNVGPDGGLNIVYGGTNAATKIIVVVRGGGGHAALESIEEADLPQNDYSGIGGQLLGSLLAPQLDLLPGGDINMTSGVGRIQLHSLGANSQIHLRDLPNTFPANTTVQTPFSATTVTTVTGTGGIVGSAGGGGTIISGSGTNSGTGTSILGTGGGTITSTGSNIVVNGPSTLSGLINNPTGTGEVSAQSTNGVFNVTSTTIVTGGNGNPVAIPPDEEPVAPPAPVGSVAPTTYTFAGRTQTYSNDPELGGTTLTNVTGQFTPTPNLITTPNPANPGPSPQPPGILIQVNSVNGSGGQIGDGQVWGYDAVANSLVRFNTVTGQLLQAFNVGGTPTNAAGVGLGRIDREQVVLLARGTVVQVFDASTGAPLGSFSVTNLAPLGFNAVDGIGYTGTVTVLSDSSALVPLQPMGTPDFGVSIGIDVKASLGQGVAVTIGKPFVTENGFTFSGGVTGIAGTNNIYNFGAAIFNSFEAPFRQAGVLTTTGFFTGSPREVTRTVLPNPSNAQKTTPTLNFGGTTGPLTGTGPALGSVEQLLAINQGVVNGVNFVRLYVPSTLTQAGTVNLQDPDPIVSLSTSFHPELVGSALVDVQGNVQTFSAKKATGLALNDNGNLDLLQINDASFSTVIAQPLSHVQIAKRNDVVLVTPARSVGLRNGVIVLPGLLPIGPLALPN